MVAHGYFLARPEGAKETAELKSRETNCQRQNYLAYGCSGGKEFFVYNRIQTMIGVGHRFWFKCWSKVLWRVSIQ
jgi:hypothetical protein